MRVSVKAIIVRDNKLLTVQLRGPKDQVPVYILPGGGQREGESAYDALQRECIEEIGVTVTPGPLLFVRDYMGTPYAQPDKTRQQVELMFSATLEPGVEPRVGNEPDVHQEDVAWLPLDSLHEYTLYPLTIRPLLADGVGNGSDVYLGAVD